MAENQPPSNFWIAEQLGPWFPLLARVGAAAQRDHLAAVPIMGLPRKTEAANDFHRTWRENFRRVCDLADPLVTLVEEPEGQGLDYLVFRTDPEHPFTMRWGRINNWGMIRRNRTFRTRDVWEQGTLFGSIEPDPDSMPNVTLGFTVEDYFTEIGQPRWWFGRLLLLRERVDGSEFITEVHVYSQPDQTADNYDVPPPIVTAREDEVQEWEQMIQQILSA